MLSWMVTASGRPATACPRAMLGGLARELDSLATDKRIRAVVLAAHGTAFSAGHDLKELTAHRADPDGGRGYTRHIMERCSASMLSVLRLAAACDCGGGSHRHGGRMPTRRHLRPRRGLHDRA